jgi:hypothetical protein
VAIDYRFTDDGLALIMHWLYGLIYWWMLCLLGCLVLGIEWGQVMEATCIYCTSLQTFPIARHPSIVPLLHFALLVVKLRVFRFLEGKARPTRHLSDFSHRYGSFLSIHDGFSVL